MEKLKEMRDFYVKFYKNFEGDEWLMRYGKEYDVMDFNFYFQDHAKMKITYHNRFSVSIEEKGEDFTISFSGDVSLAERVFDWINFNEIYFLHFLRKSIIQSTK